MERNIGNGDCRMLFDLAERVSWEQITDVLEEHGGEYEFNEDAFPCLVASLDELQPFFVHKVKLVDNDIIFFGKYIGDDYLYELSKTDFPIGQCYLILDFID